MKTQYLVLPYKLGARNKVEAQQAQACRTDGEALRTGERMAKRFLGVVVILQEVGQRIGDHVDLIAGGAEFQHVPSFVLDVQIEALARASSSMCRLKLSPASRTVNFASFLLAAMVRSLGR